MALGLAPTLAHENTQYPASPEAPRPLDIFGGVAPAFAYGLRLLDSDYAGYAIRVRRDNDDIEVEVKFDGAGNVSMASPIVDGGTEQTGSVSGGTYSGLLTLGDFGGTDTCRVVKWYDQSGNGRDAFQTVEASQPILIASGTLEADGIDFVPSDFLQANYNLTTTNDHTYHAVAKCDASANGAIFGDLDAFDDGAEVLALAGKWSYRIDGTDLEPSATTTNKTYLLCSYDQGLSTGTEQQMRINGAFAQQACDETLSFDSANRVRIGLRLTGSTHLNGKIAEVIAWNSFLTTGQQDILEENTLAHFNLPSAPYSSFCIDFDGANDYCNLGTPSTGTGAKTLSMWINPTTIVNGDRLISNTDDTGWGLQFNGGNIEAWNGSAWVVLIASPSADEWTHLAIVFDGSGNQQVYKNKVVGSNVAAAYNLSNLGLAANLSLTHGTHFDGKIDEVAIWDSALTETQISGIYGTGEPTDLTSLSPTGWWRMGEGNAISTTITDHAKVSPSNGTLVNGPLFTLDSPSY